MPKRMILSKPAARLVIALSLTCAAFLALLACANADIGGAKTHKTAAGHIAAGARFSCAIVGDGDVKCWGIGEYGTNGQANTKDVGDNEKPDSVPPIDLGPGIKATTISAGFYHACAIDQNRDLHCWGNTSGVGYDWPDSLVGDDETPADAPTVDLGDHTVKSLATGGYHSCAILDDGKLRCWGQGGQGQLGYGTSSGIFDAADAGNVDVGNGRTVKAVAAGGFHTCAILDNGKVRCWGQGNYGQTGHATKKTIGDNETPADSPYVDLGKHEAVGITAGYLHTCALLDNGAVRCWGRGISGQLGYGNKKNYGDNEKVSKAPPLRLGKNQKAVAISAFGQHTCAILKKRRKVECWGTGKYGQLGHANEKSIGDNEYPGSAGPVSLGAKALAIQTGGRHSCAVLAKGKVRCWGLNTNGQLGYGNRKSIGDDEKPSKAGPVKLGGAVQGRD